MNSEFSDYTKELACAFRQVLSPNFQYTRDAYLYLMKLEAKQCGIINRRDIYSDLFSINSFLEELSKNSKVLLKTRVLITKAAVLSYLGYTRDDYVNSGTPYCFIGYARDEVGDDREALFLFIGDTSEFALFTSDLKMIQDSLLSENITPEVSNYLDSIKNDVDRDYFESKYFLKQYKERMSLGISEERIEARTKYYSLMQGNFIRQQLIYKLTREFPTRINCILVDDDATVKRFEYDLFSGTRNFETVIDITELDEYERQALFKDYTTPFWRFNDTIMFTDKMRMLNRLVLAYKNGLVPYSRGFLLFILDFLGYDTKSIYKDYEYIIHKYSSDILLKYNDGSYSKDKTLDYEMNVLQDKLRKSNSGGCIFFYSDVILVFKNNTVSLLVDWVTMDDETIMNNLNSISCYTIGGDLNNIIKEKEKYY